jgi:hypothetical protein
VSWRLERGERVELRGASGELIAWTKARASSAVRDPDGGLVATVKPVVKFSGLDIAGMALDGAILGDAPLPRAGGFRPGGQPRFAVKDPRSQVTFAAVSQSEGGSRIDLLPDGAINDRLIGRHLDDQEVARLRERSPLSYAGTPGSVYELRDRLDTVLAREVISAAGSEIEVIDNPLPAAWLFATLLACAYQRPH